MPTSGHFLFIPAVFLFGAFFGFVMGTRAQADRAKLEARREEERAAAREARAKRKADRAEASSEAE